MFSNRLDQFWSETENACFSAPVLMNCLGATHLFIFEETSSSSNKKSTKQDSEHDQVSAWEPDMLI